MHVDDDAPPGAPAPTVDDDPRLASVGQYDDTRTACLDLDEQERMRYLYIERAMLRRYMASDGYKSADVPVLRAVAHDQAIRQVAAVRTPQAPQGRCVWDDVARDDGNA